MKKHFFLTILAAVAVVCFAGVCACTVGDKHEHSYTATIIAPTCTQKGHSHFECSCGDSYVGESVDELGHDLTTHSPKAATCTEVGWESYESCSRCDYTTYREIPALEHEKIPHVAKEATCTEVGWEAYETCERCDYTTYVEIAATGHAPEIHAARAATCTEVGWNTYVTCKNCDYTTYKEIPALDHSLTSYSGQAATCTAKGWEAYESCSRCTYTTYSEIPELGHDLTHYDAKSPTCLEHGWSAYDVCSRGDYNTLAVVNALGHDIKGVAASAPTCTQAGWNAYEACSRGDYTTYSEIPKLGHDIEEHSAKQPTCTDIGWEAYETCSRCDLNGYVELSALGHNFPDYIVDDLHHERNCLRCDLPDDGEHEWKNNTCVVCKFAVDYSAGLAYEEIYDGGVAVAYSVAGRGKAVDAKIIIPKIYNNLPVTAISERAFYANDGLIGVTLPESITTFGELCFAECSALQRIDYNAVAAEFFEDNTVFKGSGSADIGITVHIGEKVSAIPDNIFKGVSHIRNVVFDGESACTHIGINAFAGCSLKGFTVPHSVTSFGAGAFLENTALDGVYHGGNLENWLKITFADDEANPLKYAHNLYIEGELLQDLVIPDGVETINEYAFIGCSITRLTLSEGVTKIGKSAFDSCRNMLEINYNCIACKGVGGSDYVFRLAGTDGEGIAVNIGDKVTAVPANMFGGSPDPSLSSNIVRIIFGKNGVCESIGWRAFAYCCKLTEVDLGEVGTVGSGAFIGCENLITVHSSVKLSQIDAQAFMDCTLLTDFYYGGTIDEWNAVDIGLEPFFRVENCTVICSDGNISVKG